MTIEKVWMQLKKITTLELTTICRKIPPSFEKRVGKAKVIIQSQGDEEITFFEKGTWEGVQSRNKTAFTNVYCWQIDREKGVLSLSSLRLGVERPLLLFTLIPLETHFYKSLGPHECNEDTYAATLQHDDHFIALDWHVTGPKKNEA